MYIGIDLGGTNIAVGLVNDEGKIMAKASTPALSQRPIQEIIEDIAQVCGVLLNGAGMTVDDIESVGLGCPGTIDHKNGIVVYSNNICM